VRPLTWHIVTVWYMQTSHSQRLKLSTCFPRHGKSLPSTIWFSLITRVHTPADPSEAPFKSLPPTKSLVNRVHTPADPFEAPFLMFSVPHSVHHTVATAQYFLVIRMAGKEWNSLEESKEHRCISFNAAASPCVVLIWALLSTSHVHCGRHMPDVWGPEPGT
jgi:hypothetical protein